MFSLSSQSDPFSYDECDGTGGGGEEGGRVEVEEGERGRSRRRKEEEIGGIEVKGEREDERSIKDDWEEEMGRRRGRGNSLGCDATFLWSRALTQVPR